MWLMVACTNKKHFREVIIFLKIWKYVFHPKFFRPPPSPLKFGPKIGLNFSMTRLSNSTKMKSKKFGLGNMRLYGCLEKRQDLSYSAPGFKVTQKVVFMPKNLKTKIWILLIFFLLFLEYIKTVIYIVPGKRMPI